MRELLHDVRGRAQRSDSSSGMMCAVTVGLLSESAAATLQARPFTYDAVGRTAADLPAAFNHLRRERVLPPHTELETAAQALMTWQLHANSGIQVTASSATVAVGAVVVLGLGIGRLRIAAPCRVVYVVDESHRRGFAYGTLPGHPESGEERFVLEQRPDGRIELCIVAFSRPATALTRLGAPAARWMQERITHRYLHALDSP